MTVTVKELRDILGRYPSHWEVINGRTTVVAILEPRDGGQLDYVRFDGTIRKARNSRPSDVDR